MIQVSNLIFGKLVKGNVLQTTTSPIDGLIISELFSLNDDELTSTYEEFSAKQKKFKTKDNFSELVELAYFIQSRRKEFLMAIMQDAAFTMKDSEDLVNGTIEFCRDYEKHLAEIGKQELETNFSFDHLSKEKISYTSDAYGLIVATTPRNTPLITELTIIIHALWSGNSLILRPSPGVATTMSLLIEGLLKTFQKETLSRMCIVFADARNFLEIGMKYADIIHYVGSSKYLENTLISGIKSGVKVLVDGDGCSVVVVDKDVDINETVKACYEGFIRCNTQICISIRTIIIDEAIYNQFKSAFLDYINNTIVGDPKSTIQPDMGPLFSSAQVDAIIEVSKKYDVISDQNTSLEFGPNYIKPIVVELSEDNKKFLKESVFGPIVGITSFSKNGWKKWITENPINLTDSVFSNNKDFVSDFLLTSKSPRRVVNIDPTIESVFEPWGAFLPSGWNDVSYWFHKYRNFYQLITR
jgi:glyceraldehyde-3-phosphate dehydrogenase (NADP+)